MNSSLQQKYLVNTKVFRSPLFYVGDKYKLIPAIKQLFPQKIERFIEPFVGGGTVFLNIKAKEYLLNDIDHGPYEIHKFLIEQAKNPCGFFKGVEKIIREYSLTRSYIEDIVPKELKKKFNKTYYAEFNKIGFEKLKKHYNESEAKDPLEFYVLLIYGFNRMIRFNSNGKYNLPVGNVDFNSNVFSALNDYFDIVKDKVIKLYNLDYSAFLRNIDLKKKDFVYLDPPYLISFSEYNKLWNENNERELLGLLDELNTKRIKFAISNMVLHKNQENKIFGQWMMKYKIHDIKSNYISYHDNTAKQIREVLVTNYDTKKIRI